MAVEMGDWALCLSSVTGLLTSGGSTQGRCDTNKTLGAVGAELHPSIKGVPLSRIVQACEVFGRGKGPIVGRAFL